MAPKKKATGNLEKSLTDLKSLNQAELRAELKNAQSNLYVLSMKKEL